MNFLIRFVQDRHDERRARRLRDRYGSRRWLLSWQSQDDGTWLARLSCPALVDTIERRGRTRCQAIRRAARAITEALLLSDVVDS